MTAIAGSAFASLKHAETLGALLAKNPWVVVKNQLPGIAKSLELDNVMACVENKGDKYTEVYLSTRKPLIELSGAMAENAREVFDLVSSRNVGELVEISFDSEKDGKTTPMKGRAMSAGSSVVCAVIWPESKDKEMTMDKPIMMVPAVASTQPVMPPAIK